MKGRGKKNPPAGEGGGLVVGFWQVIYLRWERD